MPPIPASSLRFTACRYHRNGCTGEAFYVVWFTWRDEDGCAHQLQAAVFDRPGCCAVTSAEPDARFRGDWFEEHVRAYAESPEAQARAYG